MFKKICIFMAALFTMLISCAGPFIFNSSAAPDDVMNTFDKFVSYTGFNRNSSDYYYCYFTINYTRNGAENAIGVCVSYSKNSECPYYVEYANNILVVRSFNVSDSLDYAFADTYTNGHIVSRDGYALQLDFNNNTGYIIDTDSRYEGFTFGNITTFTFDNFETSFPEYDPIEPLDLAISFRPSLSGTVSRTQTIDGKQYTSTTLDMYVSNNGSEDAQFSMFIVNHGENISFPSSVIEDNKGFIGNPVYCYVTDEWSSFNVGMLGNSVYSPCSWHTVASGFQNQLYSIPWNMISLTANTQYDVVVYACINSTMQQTNTSSMWDMRPVYTVSSNLNDVVEVYRSSFSITDPATFNPSAIDEGGTTHSWNPNTDNSNLFNVSSAYRDDNGNIIIRGQTNSTLGDTPFSSGWFDNGTQNINSVFREYFGFLNKAIVLFPPAISVLFGIGLSSIIVIAVIKLLVKG